MGPHPKRPHLNFITPLKAHLHTQSHSEGLKVRASTCKIGGEIILAVTGGNLRALCATQFVPHVL